MSLDATHFTAQFTSGEVTFLRTIADTAYTDGQLLIGNGLTGGLSVATLTAGANITITNNHGAITIAATGGSANMVVGSSTITSGTTTRVLYDNAGVLGEYTISGSGSVAMTTSPVFTTPSLGVATATSLNGLTVTTSTGTLTIANGKTATCNATTTFAGVDGKTVTFNNSLTFAGTDSTTMTFPTTSATIARTDAANTFTGVQTMTSPVLGTPQINGTATGSGVSSTPTASILAMFDANKNLSATNLIDGFTTTATAAGTTTLVVGSNYQQYFTGATTQTVVLPTTGIVAGMQYMINNNSTGAVTVQSSGLNTIVILAGGTNAVFTALVATPTTAANWNYWYFADVFTSGKKFTVNNSLTLSGTDSTTMTFPSTSATIARTDAGQTFTGTNAFGIITATTLNGNTFTTGTYTLTGTASKTLNFTNSLTLSGTDATTITFQGTDTYVGRTTTDTLTNKRITKRVLALSAGSATPAINTDTTDVVNITAQSAAITSFTTNLTGTPVDGDTLRISITDNGTARALTFGASFEASTVALPTTTVISTRLDVGFFWNTATSKWRCVAVA